MSYVNVYLEDQAYGGRQEGGWWYTYGEVVRSTKCASGMASVQAVATLQRERALCEEENANRRSDISSVLSEGRYVATLENKPARAYPRDTPYYE